MMRKKRKCFVMLLLVCLTACEQKKETDMSINLQNTPVPVQATKDIEQSSIEKKDSSTFYDYIKENKCDNVYVIEDDIIACLTGEDENYRVDFVDLDTGEVITHLSKDFLDANVSIKKVGKYVVICQGKNIRADSKELQAVVLDESLKEEATLMLSSEVTEYAFAIMPEQKKVVYAGYYGEDWKMCLKERNYDGSKEKELLQFTDVTKVASVDGLEVSDDEKRIYFTGSYAKDQSRSGDMLGCIGVVNRETKMHTVYKKEKKGIYIHGEDACFYDEYSEETDGEICSIHEDGTISSIWLDEKDGTMTGFSTDCSHVWTLRQNTGEEEKMPYTLHIYQTKDGKMIYENEETKISWSVMVFPKSRHVLGFYEGHNGLELEVLEY